ncbi:MAG: diaminopimelate epimerase [Candidatus Heteroscillospira sp.]|jgi:diaminopimelate epimerase
MKFAKMHGAGNDYVYVNCFQEDIPDRSELAVRVSDRHFGVGADGLICICPSHIADFKMDMYNADGSRGAMCGNGIRCVGKYVYDRGMTDKTTITVESGGAVKTLLLNVEDGEVRSVRVDMGGPILKPELIPVALPGERVLLQPLEIDGTQYLITCVSMGNPHCVVFVDDVDALELETIGPKFENHPLFPQRVNTEFVQVADRNHLKMRVWERGSGETLACGTGSCASLVAAALAGKSDDSASLLLRGGQLRIDWDRAANTVYMTGPAELVFDGELYI